MRGLSVLVQPSGHKTYTVFYRINGKATDHKIGGCHEISLKQAREKAAEILVAARSGVSAAKQRMRARSSTLGGFLDSRYSDYLISSAPLLESSMSASATLGGWTNSWK